MERLTKKFIETYIENLNKVWNSDLKLLYKDNSYFLYSISDLYYSGSLKEIYVFLKGLEIGLNKGISDGEKKNCVISESGLEYFRNHLGDEKTIIAKKTCMNPSVNKYSIHYKIKINEIYNTVIYVSCIMYLESNNAKKHSKQIEIPGIRVNVELNSSIDEIVEAILKRIDRYLIKCYYNGSGLINLNHILWITEREMSQLGYYNADFVKGYLTKDVSFEML